MRDCIGSDMPLMIDANMRYTVELAIRAARRFHDYDVYWFEEPTIPDDYKGISRIAVEGGVPVAAGENLHTVYEFRHTIEDAKIAFPEPDVSNIGGITNWMRVAKLAYAHNLRSPRTAFMSCTCICWRRYPMRLIWKYTALAWNDLSRIPRN